MQTEIIKEKLKEFFYPTINWLRVTDNVLVDYAEIEINPAGISKLEVNLDRNGDHSVYTKDEWKELTNPESDIYEHVIAYVHFGAGTDNFNKIFLIVKTSYGECELEVDKILNEEEKTLIIEYARELLNAARKAGNAINENMEEKFGKIKWERTFK